MRAVILLVLAALPASAAAEWRLAPRFGLGLRQGTAASTLMQPALGLDVTGPLPQPFGLRFSLGVGFEQRGTRVASVRAADGVLSVSVSAGVDIHPAARLFAGLGAGGHLLLFETHAGDDRRLAADTGLGLVWIAGARIELAPVTVDFVGQGLAQQGNHRLQFYVAVGFAL